VKKEEKNVVQRERRTFAPSFGRPGREGGAGDRERGGERRGDLDGIIAFTNYSLVKSLIGVLEGKEKRPRGGRERSEEKCSSECYTFSTLLSC